MPLFSSNTTRSTTTAATNARNATPTKADNKAKGNKEAEANAAIPTANAPDVGSNKAAREFEHGCQRAKKTERTANYRAEKAHNKQMKAIRLAGVVDTERKSHGSRVGGRAAQVKPTERADKDLESDSEDSYCEKELGWKNHWAEGPISFKKSDEKVEIDLTAIMQPAKARKSKVADFEVVPAIRGVVVLDDKFSVDNTMEIDEPWECIDVDDDMEIVEAPVRRRPLTYADVLR